MAAARLRGVAWLRLAFLWLALLATPAQAQIQLSPDSLRVSLVTFSPGPLYWERFGHNAILLRDTASGETLLFNYGIFDFNQKHFFLNFARGRMQYRLAVQPLDEALDGYAAEGRWALEQELALDATQREALARFLVWNAQPEHAEYRYDYFTANCSTRVRDALDAVLGGALRAHGERQPAHSSYRHEATRLMGPVLPLSVAMDLALGPVADRPIDRWQQSFVPMALRDAMRGLPRADGTPLVLRETWLLRSAAGDGPAAPPALWRWQLGGGLLLGVTLLLLGHARPRSAVAARAFATLASLLLLLAGLGGLLLLALWGLTEHWAGWANRNLLLFNPLALLLLPAVWRSRDRALPPSRAASSLALLFALGGLLAVALQALPAAQQHAGWIALWLPIQLTLAWLLAWALFLRKA